MLPTQVPTVGLTVGEVVGSSVRTVVVGKPVPEVVGGIVPSEGETVGSETSPTEGLSVGNGVLPSQPPQKTASPYTQGHVTPVSHFELHVREVATSPGQSASSTVTK